jgi:hypothetical protein
MRGASEGRLRGLPAGQRAAEAGPVRLSVRPRVPDAACLPPGCPACASGMPRCAVSMVATARMRKAPGPLPGRAPYFTQVQCINRGSPRLTTLTPEELAALENPDIIAIDQSGSQPSTAVISGNIEAVRKELNEKGNADQSDQDSVG